MVAKNSKQIFLTALPTFLYGGAVTLTWAVIGGPWYQASEFQLRAGLIVGLAMAGVVAFGGIFAILRRFPGWGFTWIGMDMIGILLLLQGISEERAYLISKGADTAILIGAALFILFILFKASSLSWQVVTLVSIGMASAFALSTFHLMAIGPYHRVDIAQTALIFGLVYSVIIIKFLRSSYKMQISLFIFASLLSMGILWMASDVWSANRVAAGEPSPLLPMMALLLLMLVSGPIIGVIYKPLIRIFHSLAK